MRRKVIAKLVRVLLLSGMAVAFVTPSFGVKAQSHAAVQIITNPQITAVENAKSARTATERKISSQLLNAINAKQTGHVLAGVPSLGADSQAHVGQGWIVDISAKVSPALLESIRGIGGTVQNYSTRYGTIRAVIPPQRIKAVAGNPNVRSIQQKEEFDTNSVGVATEGAIAHMADIARSQFLVRGRGIKIGVLSDSIDDGSGSERRSFQVGALDKAELIVLPGQDGDGTGEGLAMLEIVHAIAPDATLYFATGNGNAGNMADNIDSLRKLGCQIIVDDVSYYDESPFQDGPIAQAVQAASDAGILYFSSARNSGNQADNTAGTWEGDFRDGGPAGPQYSNAGAQPNSRIHVFDGSITLNTIDGSDGTDRVDLFWSDPLGQSTNEYDLFEVNNQGQVIRESTTSMTGSSDPYQAIQHLDQGDSIVIVKTSNAASRFLHIDVGRAQLRHSTNGSIRGHNASEAQNAFTIAAVRVPTPIGPFSGSLGTSVESFSSDGPRRMFFLSDGTAITPGNFSSNGGRVFSKPEFAGADGVSTSLPSASGLNPFSGTSAAAPHAAAIAALMLSCAPRPSPNQIRTALQSTAIPIRGGRATATAIFGIISARDAVAKVCGRAAVSGNSRR